MTTIALIDDHLIVRSGFAQLLGLEPDFQVVAEFGSGPRGAGGAAGARRAGLYLRYLDAGSPGWSC
jgi:DNA-binding NarL/FixJ family response regulator